MNHPLALVDVDPLETREWLEALEAVTTVEGRSRAHYLIDRLTDFDASRHGDMHGRVTSAYVNTIGKDRQPAYPGDIGIEQRLNAYIRWNAMVMVLRAGKHSNVGDNVLMLADGNGDYAKALGLEMDGRGFGMGTRGQRFALVVEDGVAKKVEVEAPREFKVSSAEHILSGL